MKKCSTPLAIRELSIETPVVAHLVPVRASTRKQMASAGRIQVKGNPPYTRLAGVHASQATVEASMKVPLKVKVELPYDPMTSFLGIPPRKYKAASLPS